jgi:hypothetical protein
MAFRIGLYSFAVLLASLWLGGYILNFFGVSLGALRIAGGLVVAVRAWSLLMEPEVHEERKAHQAEPAQHAADIAFFPLTMPLTTGPGSIAVAIALSSQRPTGTGEPLGFFGAQPGGSGHRGDDLALLSLVGQCHGHAGPGRGAGHVAAGGVSLALRRRADHRDGRCGRGWADRDRAPLSKPAARERVMFVDSCEIRTRFCAALSAMYRAGAALRRSAGHCRAGECACRRRPARVEIERHGAIRVGTPAELAMMLRAFAVMGMHPVGYYDLAPRACRSIRPPFARSRKRRWPAIPASSARCCGWS